MTIEIDFKPLQDIAALQRPNKPSLLAQVVSLFESESPKCIAQILDGVAMDDIEAIRMGAHSLKSSAANVGAQALSGRCRDIENAARLGDIEQCSELSTELMGDIDGSVAAIRMYMERAA